MRAWMRRTAVLAVAVLVGSGAVGVAAVPGASPAAGAPSPTTSGYEALPAPQRILDTRTGLGGHLGVVGANQQITVKVPGAPSGASAVAINLTGTQATGVTFLAAFGTTFTGTSNLNLSPTDATAAVFATVPLSPDHTIQVLNRAGTVQVVVDELGFFVKDAGDGYAPVRPTRIFDTRPLTATPPAVKQKLTDRDTVMVRPPARLGVPTDASVIVNITAADMQAPGHLTAAATGAGTVLASTLNYSQFIRANLAVVPLHDGSFELFNRGGPVDAIIDIVGYFAPGASAHYVPLASERIVDTRTGTGGRSTPLGQDEAMTVEGAGVNGVPEDAEALLTGIVAVPVSGPASFLSVFPAPPRPRAFSTVNFSPGRIVANAAIANLSGGSFEVYNNAGVTNVVMDLFGYFVPPECQVTNEDTGRRFTSLQTAVTNAAAGEHLAVTGTCSGAVIDKNLTISGNNGTATLRGGPEGTGHVLLITGGAEVTLNTLEITGGDASFGGGIYNELGTVTVNDSIVTGNHAADGGGIVSAGSATTLTLDKGSRVTDNTADDFAGGIENFNRGTVIITGGSTVTKNTAKDFAGGIFNINSEMTLDHGSSVAENEATNGAGIYNAHGGTFTLDHGSTVTKNIATGRGGGIDNVGSETVLTLDHASTVTYNTASGRGGGISNLGGGTVTLNDSTVSLNNTTGTHGGGIGNDNGSHVTMNGSSTINNNHSRDDGGGIDNDHSSTVTMNGSSTIDNNEADNNGGGIYTTNSSTVDMTGGGTISGNTAGNNGGGIWTQSCTLLLGVVAGTGGNVDGNNPNDLNISCP